MKFELNFLPTNATDEDIFDEVRRVDTIVGKDVLTASDFNKHSKISSSALRLRFGDWQNVLMKAGLDHKYSGIKVSEKMRQQQSKNLTDEEIFNELRRIAKKLNQNYLTQTDINNNSKTIAATLIVYRFGSWAKGLKKAGLRKSPRSTIRLSDDELYENLLNVWSHHGRQPYLREMDEMPSEVSSGAYENRFGGWKRALEAFVARMNQDDNGNEQVLKKDEPTSEIRKEIKSHCVPVEDRHGIGLGLRYKVLSRDKFKCVRCGANPAHDPMCRLHIDHIVPHSKQGKTVLENLQTLCENCNLGKGNRYLE